MSAPVEKGEYLGVKWEIEQDVYEWDYCGMIFTTFLRSGTEFELCCSETNIFTYDDTIPGIKEKIFQEIDAILFLQYQVDGQKYQECEIKFDNL